MDRRDDIGYDETESVVVAAHTADAARVTATGVRGDQDGAVWFRAEVTLIGTARPPASSRERSCTRATQADRQGSQVIMMSSLPQTPPRVRIEPDLATSITAWIQADADVAPDRADEAGRALAAAWHEGDFDYQTVVDILGDWLTDDEPRPKLLADRLASAFGHTLT